MSKFITIPSAWIGLLMMASCPESFSRIALLEPGRATDVCLQQESSQRIRKMVLSSHGTDRAILIIRSTGPRNEKSGLLV
jgi:hypothetical protein